VAEGSSKSCQHRRLHKDDSRGAHAGNRSTGLTDWEDLKKYKIWIIYEKRLLFVSLMANILVFLPGMSSGLSLDEAVALALENNPGLQKQQMNRA